MKFQDLNLSADVRMGENVVLTGKITIGSQSSIWHNVILRGDVEPITIGQRCNIQDNTVLHGQLGRFAVRVGDGVSVGHSCIIHGCELADDSFVGMGSIIMNGAYIGSRVLVAAGTLVAQNARFDQPNTLVMGRPGKIVRELRENELKMILETPGNYITYAREWLALRKT